MKTHALVRHLLATLLLVLTACTPESKEQFFRENEIKLNGYVTSGGRGTDQDLQSTMIAEGQQVGVTILGASSKHTNVCWTAGENGILVNTGAAAYWSGSDITVRAYHPYHADWTAANQVFHVQTDQTTDEGYLDSDLLWASTTASKSNLPVDLPFTHKLSKINVTLFSDGNHDLSKALITLCGTNTATGFNLETGELFAVEEKIADIQASITTADAYTASAVIVPQTLEEGSQFIKITLGEEDFHYTLPTDQVFESGQAYNFTLKVKLEDNIEMETDYVDLKFDDPGVTTRYNESDGSLAVTYPTSSMPVVNEGNAIVLPAQYNYDIRVVESVSKSGNTLNLRTSQGDMTNLFRNTSFTLTTDPQVASRAVGMNVYTPTSYGYIDGNGRYVEVYNEKTAGRAEQTMEHNIWEFHMDFNGEKIYDGEAGTLSWDKCEFDAGLKGTFTFDFGEKEINEVRKKGDLKKFAYKLTGSVGMDLLLHYEYEYEYHEYKDEIIKKNVIPTIRINFMVGTVFVTVSVDTHLGKATECRVHGAVEEDSNKLIDATAGVKLGTEMSVGMEWTPENGAVPTHEVVPTFEIYPLTVQANAYAEAKVSYYPQIVIGLYKFLGPWFETRPYLKETVEAGLHYSPGSDENYIGWQANTYNGMDLRLGLKLDFIGWEWNAWTSEVFNGIKDRLLFEAPSRIRTLAPENNIEVKQGESVTAEFMVESFSPITNKYYPCPLALINFEPESGELDKALAVTGLDGKASVDWTPNPYDWKGDDHGGGSGIGGAETLPQSRSGAFVTSMLTAKVVKANGELISETGVVVKVEDKLREALIKLYKSTNGDNWTRNDNWCSDLPLEDWYGVRFHYASHSHSDKLLTLELDDNNLIGKIEQTFPDDMVGVLHFSGNQLTSLDVSGCTSLYELDCADNQLTSLDVSGCTSLTKLYCGANQLTSLDVSGCTSLSELGCADNQLTSLDASGCTSLTEWNFSYQDNPLAFLNLSGCTSLEELDFNRTLSDKKLTTLSSLDVSNCTALTNLSCNDNQLTSLDVTNCTALTNLSCDNNQLTSLDVTKCTALNELSCSNNQLTSLDVSNCKALWHLACSYNQLISLDVTQCTLLTYLNCSNNQLTSLDVTQCTLLKGLSCSYNQLTSLDVTQCTLLEWLGCSNNLLTSLDASGLTKLDLDFYSVNCKTMTSLNLSGCTSIDFLGYISSADFPIENLTSLDVSDCTSLKYLWCPRGKLTSLNVSGCTSLTELYCSENQLTSLEMTDCYPVYFNCENNKITSVIPETHYGLFYSDNYDIRYEYYEVKIGDEWVTQYKDKGYGWWYEGEPGKGKHSPY